MCTCLHICFLVVMGLSKGKIAPTMLLIRCIMAHSGFYTIVHRSTLFMLMERDLPLKISLIVLLTLNFRLELRIINIGGCTLDDGIPSIFISSKYG